MPLLNLSFNNFRNIENNTIDLLSKEVYFVGENGQGKTNILEAIYLCSYATSFKTHTDNEIIKYGENTYNVKAFYREENGATSLISVGYENNKINKKLVLKNNKKIKDKKEMINTIPCVLFCHEDLDFAIGEPERRRFFIDQSLSMYDVLYIDIFRNYKKILKSRNTVLKEKKYEMLDVYDLQLAQTGKEIVKKRDNTIYQFNRIFSNVFEEVSGISGVNIKYDSTWKNLDTVDIVKILNEKKEMDKVLGVTMSGPHRDKIKFVKDGKLFIPTASTGQRRLISLVLRIAQAKYFTEITQKKPILLMDDVLLELDPDKRQKITSLLPEYDQLFCTFLPGEPYERYKRTTTKVYMINNGSWK